ncbi:MAG: GcrA cell cycle regulator [Aestuariivita sp.]|nr:GcrA cell cycle regulator [Aestuariivita sp.]MCY4346941.1 GcrA cell cycle regulator [Aestuariivita sp.]
MRRTVWTKERVSILQKLWFEGLKPADIAIKLGDVTRSAVIGKARRLNLPNRTASPPASKSKKGASQPPATNKKPDLKTEPAIPINSSRKPSKNPRANRQQIISAERPLPPQPSANEISQEALARVHEVERNARKLSLLELTSRTCKWPVGDPATKDFWFCGLPVQPGKPYCEAHVEVALQPIGPRRDRRR